MANRAHGHAERNQSAWGPGGPEIDVSIAPKRQRLFIARQACETCRQKKTRCDGGNPCGLCRDGGLECQYAERKATKNEVSLGMIFNTLQRIEAKIESQQNQNNEPANGEDQRGHQTAKRSRHGSSVPAAQMLTAMSSPPMAEAVSISVTSPSAQQRSYQPRPQHVPVIQYPIRQLANWPAIREVLQGAGTQETSSDGNVYPYFYDSATATLLEKRRPPLRLPSAVLTADDGWLAQLSIALVRDLGDRYFSTFNLANPVLDRRLFSQHSLGVAIQTGFGVNVESCVVLATMALGVLGGRALRQAGVVLGGVHSGHANAPYEHGEEGDDDDAWDGGLVFLYESRKRFGLLDCEHSLHACQYHLLCGLFYAQLLRPLDWWTHASRAAACCTSFWACVPNDCDEWSMDMQARLFWITALFEALLTQELDVPVSSLLSYEDRVPLPKFVEFTGILSHRASPSHVGSAGASFGILPMASSTSLPSLAAAAAEAEQDAFCHYHFLSQIAHRIILTRLSDSIFANRGKALALGLSIEAASQATTTARSDYPPQAVEDELLHQLEQWRSQLPSYLQWQDSEVEGILDNDDDQYSPPRAPPTPADIFVVPWLQARYCIARYHLRRPLLHRALHHPDWMSTAELDTCRDALACAVRWCAVIRPTLRVADCLYLKFFICTQFFGHLLLLHAFQSSPVPTLRALVPVAYESWRVTVLNFLQRCAPLSPSMARELAIVSSLCEDSRKKGGYASAGIDSDEQLLAGVSDHGDVDQRHTRSSRRVTLHEPT